MAEADAVQVADLLRQITRFLKHEVARNFGDLGITQPQLGVLRLVARLEGSPTLSEIGQELRLANSTVSGVVKRLERNGLLACDRDPQDLRVTRVRLTARARGIHEKLHRRHTECISRLLDTLEPEAVVQLRESLGQVVNAIHRVADGGDRKRGSL